MYFSYIKRFYQNCELFRSPFPPFCTIRTKTEWTYVQWTRAIRNSMRTPSLTETAQPTAPSNLQNTHGATCASLISRTVTRRMGIKICPAGNKQFRRFDQEIARGSSGGACKQLARILPRSSTQHRGRRERPTRRQEEKQRRREKGIAVRAERGNDTFYRLTLRRAEDSPIFVPRASYRTIFTFRAALSPFSINPNANKQNRGKGRER